jgi:hypothetical protein
MRARKDASPWRAYIDKPPGYKFEIFSAAQLNSFRMCMRYAKRKVKAVLCREECCYKVEML